MKKYADTEGHSVVPDDERKEIEANLEAKRRKDAEMRQAFNGIVSRPSAQRFKS